MINPSFLSHIGLTLNRQPIHNLYRWFVDVPVKFQFCTLKTVWMHVEFTFFEWLTLYFWDPWGNVESSTHSRLVPESHWRTCEVSALYLENCANACWIYDFCVINPLFLSHIGLTLNRQPIHNLYRWFVDVPVKFQFCILKTVWMHFEFTFFEWLTLYFWDPWGNVELSTHSRPVPESHWRTCEVSALYLENCANACWIDGFWVINPLFLSPMG